MTVANISGNVYQRDTRSIHELRLHLRIFDQAPSTSVLAIDPHTNPELWNRACKGALDQL